MLSLSSMKIVDSSPGWIGNIALNCYPIFFECDNSMEWFTTFSEGDMCATVDSYFSRIRKDIDTLVVDSSWICEIEMIGFVFSYIVVLVGALNITEVILAFNFNSSILTHNVPRLVCLDASHDLMRHGRIGVSSICSSVCEISWASFTTSGSWPSFNECIGNRHNLVGIDTSVSHQSVDFTVLLGVKFGVQTSNCLPVLVKADGKSAFWICINVCEMAMESWICAHCGFIVPSITWYNLWICEGRFSTSSASPILCTDVAWFAGVSCHPWLDLDATTIFWLESEVRHSWGEFVVRHSFTTESIIGSVSCSDEEFTKFIDDGSVRLIIWHLSSFCTCRDSISGNRSWLSSLRHGCKLKSVGVA